MDMWATWNGQPVSKKELNDMLDTPYILFDEKNENPSVIGFWFGHPIILRVTREEYGEFCREGISQAVKELDPFLNKKSLWQRLLEWALSNIRKGF